MSQIAEQIGVGRQTLYKYFPDVEAILVAWHERHVNAHLEHLTAVRDQAADPGERLDAVLTTRAHLSYEVARKDHGAELTTLLRRNDHLARAQRQLHTLIRDVLTDAANAGRIRDDIPADELATYCRHALDAAGSLPSKAAIRRLVTLTLAALQP